MAPESVTYTLVGFAAELDWRPLHFVRPIPRNWICSACGLVRKMNAWLPCMHVLCDSCYQQCGDDGCHICPLDAKECLENDAKWMEFPAEEVLKREVRCWNKEYGCGTVMAASDISLHFQRDCGHHSSCCPKCSASILCSDMCAHLRSACATPALTFAFDRDSELREVDGAAFPTSSEQALKELQEQAGEMRAYLEQLFTDVGAHGDSLNEIFQGINTFKEDLAQTRREILDGLRLGVRETDSVNNENKERLMTRNDAVNNFSARQETVGKTLDEQLPNTRILSGENSSEIVAAIQEFKENSQKVLNFISTVLRRDERRAAHTVFYVKGLKSLQEKVLKQGYAVYESEQVYLCGYCMSPRITLKKIGDSVHVHAGLRLRSGDLDDVVQWPFEHKIRLSVKHPAGKAELQIEIDPWRQLHWFRRPTENNTAAVLFSAVSVTLGDLTRDGYVFEDQLRIKWEVLP